MDSHKIIVLIASHIFNKKRIHFLMESIKSILSQTQKTKAYISISFDTPELKEEFTKSCICSDEITYILQEHKTPQMRHYKILCDTLIEKEGPLTWVLFCDDDDTYVPTRVETFLNKINHNTNALSISGNDPINFVGIYEAKENHRSMRHEYWCYCIRFSILQKFYSRIDAFPDVIDHKCCDILFAEYIRRLSFDNLFDNIETPMYNYRRGDDNMDSITGFITQEESKIHKSNPPPITDIAIIDYLLKWNEYLNKNLHYYLHDTFVRTVMGTSFNKIVQSEFLRDYPYIDFIDMIHTEKMLNIHTMVKEACNKSFDIPITFH